MVTLDFRTLTVPVGIVRILEVIFTCITFSLVASVGHSTNSFWTWCMFTWCFCFCVTFLIIVLEFTSLSAKLPISWDDFTTAFAMLATLMVLAASIIYPIFFIKFCSSCGKQIAATVLSCLTFILYAVEVGLTRAKPGEISGFLSTVPGLLKVLEAFVACIIFICLDYNQFSKYAGLQWCVAVYCICFIFAVLVIIFTICRLLSLFPAPFDKVLTGCNVLAVLMYITAAVVWPVYSFKNNSRPSYSSCPVGLCPWDNLLVISFMTCFNLAAYIADTVYSFRLVFFIRRT
ncbi:myeloid-associated differentiation marker homolog [Perca fluviatilis]|uniref:myeloid-associated differentiation marker homolog n=1 Tax=Perca fluviatilis TaxID=8168 RepID=UPI001963AB2E|nr:myeloid-associated differentiation marker homolog [Perca fluviatilis]